MQSRIHAKSSVRQYDFRQRVIVGHNHPRKPSFSVRISIFYASLDGGGTYVGIELLDHFVVGGEEYISLKEFGAFKTVQKNEKLNFESESRLFSIFTKNIIEN